MNIGLGGVGVIQRMAPRLSSASSSDLLHATPSMQMLQPYATS
jgi:hypothetical protein